MFKLADKPTFRHVVTAMVPIDGGFREETFAVTYNAIPAEDVDQFDTGTVKGSTAFLRRVIFSLDDIAGPDGKALPYSDELRDEVIRFPWARRAIAAGYFD